MIKPRALDLCCKAGGATKGLQWAGFTVLGVDKEPQPRYCGDAFLQGDALTIPITRTAPSTGHERDIALTDFDFIWASPPCQRFSDLAKRNGNAHEWPDLIAPIRERLQAAGVLWVIENVEGAPLRNPLVLCGTMFPPLRVLRHRLFETSFPIERLDHPAHPLCHTRDKRKAHYGKTNDMRDFVQVTGGGNSSVAAARDAMGIDWMTKDELNQAIPPAYALYIGNAAIDHMTTPPPHTVRDL